MEQSREEILANFQACTGIEDIAEALDVLEQADWDLMRAVNHAIPFEPQPQQNDSTTATVATSIEDDDLVEVIDGAFHQVDPQPSTARQTRRSTRSQMSEPSTSRPKSTNPRSLVFVIHHKDRVVLNYTIPDTYSVLDLKQLIARNTTFPVCRQILRGWVRTPANDNVLLSELSLPLENTLFLTTLSAPVPMDDEPADMGERLARRYALNIHDESSNKMYNLNFPGTRTVLEVKNDVYSLTDIPIRHQVWSGWPSSLDDTSCLALSGISFPTHDLTVKRSVIQSTKNSQIPVKDSNRDKHRKILVDLVDSDNSSVEEFEDASESFNIEDDIFIDNVETKKIEPLIPDNVEDEAIGCIHFSERFTSRYGGAHPAFFTGTLEDAIKEASSKPAKDKRLLALYLHHDASVLSNVFCTQLLGFESVLQTLEANFIVWGWDMTNEANKNKLLGSINSNLGNIANLAVRNIAVDKYPVLIIIMRMRSTTEIFNIIYGNVGVNELIGGLMEAVEVFSEHQRVEIREEHERADREMVKREQDEAYQESLEADRAKEAFRREQKAQIEEEQRRIEAERQEAAAIKEAHRQRLESCLPPEPSGACGDGIAQIRFRLPKGQVLDRKFLCSETLQILLNYITVKGYPQTEYKVISSWPRRDLTTVNAEQTLLDLKLYPQETVMIEER